MKTPIQFVLLHKPSRWCFYSMPERFTPVILRSVFEHRPVKRLWAVMLGRIEIRLRWPMAIRLFVREA